jgi:hypothetical protein
MTSAISGQSSGTTSLPHGAGARASRSAEAAQSIRSRGWHHKVVFDASEFALSAVAA